MGPASRSVLGLSVNHGITLALEFMLLRVEWPQSVMDVKASHALRKSNFSFLQYQVVLEEREVEGW